MPLESEHLDILRLLIGLLFLSYASYRDVRTRSVKNEVWILLTVLAFVVLIANMVMDASPWHYYVMLVPIAALFVPAFMDLSSLVGEEREGYVSYGIAFSGFIPVILVYYYFGSDQSFLQLLSIPIMVAVIHIFYYINVIHGGADAKALMAIAVLVPRYPAIGPFPAFSLDPTPLQTMQLYFPFAFVVLLNSALVVVIVLPLSLAIYNTAKGNIEFPEMFFGYKMGLERSKKKFIWYMSQIRGGKEVRAIFPRKENDKKEEYRKLKEYGLEEVWINPKLPFIVPIAIGFVLSFLVGNLLIAILHLLF